MQATQQNTAITRLINGDPLRYVDICPAGAEKQLGPDGTDPGIINPASINQELLAFLFNNVKIKITALGITAAPKFVIGERNKEIKFLIENVSVYGFSRYQALKASDADETLPSFERYIRPSIVLGMKNAELPYMAMSYIQKFLIEQFFLHATYTANGAVVPNDPDHRQFAIETGNGEQTVVFTGISSKQPPTKDRVIFPGGSPGKNPPFPSVRLDASAYQDLVRPAKSYSPWSGWPMNKEKKMYTIYATPMDFRKSEETKMKESSSKTQNCDSDVMPVRMQTTGGPVSVKFYDCFHSRAGCPSGTKLFCMKASTDKTMSTGYTANLVMAPEIHAGTKSSVKYVVHVMVIMGKIEKTETYDDDELCGGMPMMNVGLHAETPVAVAAECAVSTRLDELGV